MKLSILPFVCAVFLATAALAEFRTWTGRTGSQISAELIEDSGDRIILQDEAGREIMVLRSYLSDMDQAYLESRAVPVMGIHPDVEVAAEYRTGQGIVQLVRYTIDIRKVSSETYDPPIGMVLYLIGRMGDEDTYVVLQCSEERIRFTPRQRNLRISGPELVLGSRNLREKYKIDYIGHLVLLIAPDGRIVNVESDIDLLRDNAGAISRFGAGDIFTGDMQRVE